MRLDYQLNDYIKKTDQASIEVDGGEPISSVSIAVRDEKNVLVRDLALVMPTLRNLTVTLTDSYDLSQSGYATLLEKSIVAEPYCSEEL